MTDPRQLLAAAAQTLADAGVDTPRVDAELLLAELLDLPRSRLLTLADVPEAAAGDYQHWIARRAAREPLQHITGRAPFRNLLISVGPGVFVPRPETELLVDAVLPELAGRVETLVVDLCAGSGALALAVADESPAARVVAVEKSPAAARYLTSNAAGTRVQVVLGDIADPQLLRPLHGAVDVVVSNPPYVPSTTAVSPEVRADPADAVFAGAAGLELLPTVIARAAELLRDGGLLAVEHDDTHEHAVADLLRADGRFTELADHRDLSGRARFATARRCTGHSVLGQDV
jgi:release factor glutamine methyltransferase